MKYQVRLVLPSVAAALATLEKQGPKLTPAEEIMLPRVIHQVGKQTAALQRRNCKAWHLPHQQ